MIGSALQISSALLCCFAASHALADAINVNFDTSGPTTAGQLPGGSDMRAAGDANQWYVPDNAATFGEVRAGVGLNGSQGLVVGNRGNGFDGVIDNVKSGKLAQSAGESSTGAPSKTFSSSYWFRTASTSKVADFAFKSETWGRDRTSWIGFFDNGSTGLEVDAVGYLAGGLEDYRTSTATLNYGDWYRVVTNIAFNDGIDNDIVDQYVFDANGNMVTSFTGLPSWEGYYETYAPPTFAVDSIGFQARYSPTGDTVYIDDVSLSSDPTGLAVPEPGSLGLALAAVFACVATTRRRRS